MALVHSEGPYHNVTQKQIASSSDSLPLAYWVRRPSAAGNRHLLLLHGAASNHTRWSEFVDHTRLSADWTIVFPDMRGNGESRTRGRQDMDIWCDDLIDILDAEHAGSAIVAGHSLGAQIAINFAHRNPDRTRGLVLIDPVFQSSMRGTQATVNSARSLPRSVPSAAGLGSPTSCSIWVIRALNIVGIHRRNVRDRDLRELDEETREAIRGAESLEAIAKRYGALGPILRHMPTVNYLRQALATVSPPPPASEISVPVLVLLSGGTTLASVDLNRAEAARFPNSEIVMLEANHWPLTETPDAVREAIDDWVSSRFGNT